MRARIVIASLVLTACVPTDPNSSRYEMQYVEVPDAVNVAPWAQADATCNSRGAIAEQRMEAMLRSENSSASGGNMMSGIASGMRQSRLSHEAGENAYSGCMAERGWVEQSVCTANCPI